MLAARRESVRKPRDGKAYQGLLVGGPADIARELSPRLRESFGIAVIEHWPSEASKRNTPKGAIPKGTEIVIMLTDLMGRGLSDSTTRLAKSAGVPFVLTGRKRSAWVPGLVAVGFELEPAWLKAPEPEPVVEDATSVTYESQTRQDEGDVPTNLLQALMSLPTVVVDDFPSVKWSPAKAVESDARQDAVHVIANLQPVSLTIAMKTLVNMHTEQAVTVALSNLMTQKVVVERADKRLALTPHAMQQLSVGKHFDGQPLNPYHDSVPPKMLLVQEAMTKHGHADAIFNVGGVERFVRLAHTHVRHLALSPEGLAFQCWTADKEIVNVAVPWRDVKAVGASGSWRGSVSATNTKPENIPVPSDLIEVPPADHQEKLVLRVFNAVRGVENCTERDVLDRVKVKTAFVRWAVQFLVDKRIVLRVGDVLSPTRVEPDAPPPQPMAVVVESAPVYVPPPPVKPAPAPVAAPVAPKPEETPGDPDLPDVVYRYMCERGTMRLSDIAMVSRQKMAVVRWAIARLVETGKAIDKGGNVYEPVLPKGPVPTKKKVVASPAPDAIVEEDIAVEPEADDADDISNAEFKILVSKRLMAVIDNLVDLRERVMRVSKRQRVMEKIIVRMYTELGGEKAVDELVTIMSESEG